MGQGLEAVLITNLGDGGIGLPEVVDDALLAAFQHPFIDGLMEHGIEDAAEGGGGIASQLGKFFHGLHFEVVLQYEILEAVGVLGEGMCQHGEFVVGVAQRQDEGKFLLLEGEQLLADFLSCEVGLGAVQEVLQFGGYLKRGKDEGRGDFRGEVQVAAFAKEFGLFEAVAHALHVGHGEDFVLGADGLEDEFAGVERDACVFLAVDQCFAFHQEYHDVFLGAADTVVVASGMGGIKYCIVYSLRALSAFVNTGSTYGGFMHH